MKILITGGNSSVGIYLKNKLFTQNEVITAGRKDCDLKWDWNNHPNQFEFPNSVDTIIHTAANFGGNDYNSIIEAEQFNILGTLKVCELAKANNVKHFVHISSIFSKLNLDSPFYSIYALSKKQSEEIVQFYLKESNVGFVILRPSQLYGIDEMFRKHQPFFYQIIDKVKNREEITFYGNKTPLRNYLFINDLTEIVTKVVEKKILGVYDCIHPKNVSYEEIATLGFKILQTEKKISFISEKSTLPDNIFHYNDKLYKLINFYPQVSLEDGIQQIIYSHES